MSQILQNIQFSKEISFYVAAYCLLLNGDIIPKVKAFGCGMYIFTWACIGNLLAAMKVQAGTFPDGGVRANANGGFELHPAQFQEPRVGRSSESYMKEG